MSKTFDSVESEKAKQVQGDEEQTGSAVDAPKPVKSAKDSAAKRAY